MNQRIVLAMSGGVDSSASAYLLQEQGYDVIGLFMRSGATEPAVCETNSLPIVNVAEHKQGCCSASDAADARRVADTLDIPFHALNFENAFGRIKDYFADEYLAGRTPNPCVMCNNWLKFGKLWDFAQQVGATRIASGHYAQLKDVGEDVPALVRGRDRGKDQSYVLFGIPRDLLGKIEFPVGDIEKPHLREMARQVGIKTADKKDSQEICFIPDNNYVNFIEQYRGPQETQGDFVDTAGQVLGQHDGYQRFTVGQRRGLGIALGTPKFVVKIEPSTRQVVLGDQADLARNSLEATGLNWLVADVPSTLRCLAQIRYRHEAVPATATLVEEDRLLIEFDEPEHGVSPGQAVVLYDNDRVLGGGWIR